jgi:hypothetical protein
MVCGIACLAFAFVCSGAGFGPHMELIPEQIVGVVLFPDGHTPAANLPVRVWDVDREKTIYRTQTDDDGVFEIPELKPGRMQIFIGRMKVDIRILDKAVNAVHQRHDIVLVVGRRAILPLRFDSQSVLFMGGAAGLVPLLLPELLNPPPDPAVMSP